MTHVVTTFTATLARAAVLTQDEYAVLTHPAIGAMGYIKRFITDLANSADAAD